MRYTSVVFEPVLSVIQRLYLSCAVSGSSSVGALAMAWQTGSSIASSVPSRLIPDSGSAAPPPRCAERLSLSVRQDKRKLFSQPFRKG